jgi:hypothetical protein
VSIEITGIARKKPVPVAKKAEGKPPTRAPAAAPKAPAAAAAPKK